MGRRVGVRGQNRDARKRERGQDGGHRLAVRRRLTQAEQIQAKQIQAFSFRWKNVEEITAVILTGVEI